MWAIEVLELVRERGVFEGYTVSKNIELVLNKAAKSITRK